MVRKRNLLPLPLCRLYQGITRQAALLGHGLLAQVFGFLFSSAEAWGQRRAPLEFLRREFQRRQAGELVPSTQWYWYLLGLLVFIVMLGAVAWVVERFRNRRPYKSRWLLFLELCWVHRLGWRQIWELWRWIRQEKIYPPARVFCEPELWEDHVDFVTLAAGGRDGSPWTALYERCFGRLIPTAQTLPRSGPSSAESPSSADSK